MLITLPVALGLGGEISRVGTTTFACMVIAIDMTAEAVVRRSRDRSDLFRVYGAGRLFTATRLLIFETLGQVIVPLARNMVGLAIIVTIVCETLVNPRDGVGARLVTALGEADLTRVYAFLLLTGVTASLLNYLTVVAARRLIYWT